MGRAAHLDALFGMRAPLDNSDKRVVNGKVHDWHAEPDGGLVGTEGHEARRGRASPFRQFGAAERLLGRMFGGPHRRGFSTSCGYFGCPDQA